MRRAIGLMLVFVMLFLTSCSGNNSPGHSSPAPFVPGESSAAESGAPDSSSAPEASSLPESSAGDRENSVEPPYYESFSWVVAPNIGAERMFPLRNADDPGTLTSSPLILFEADGLLGIRNPDGEIVLPAEYFDIAYSASSGGIIALPAGSTSYVRLNAQYEPMFDVEYMYDIMPQALYFWDSHNRIVRYAETGEPYADDAFVIIAESDGSEGPFAIANGAGLTTGFSYQGFGPNTMSNQFWLKDSSGWHLVTPSGDDLLSEVSVMPRKERSLRMVNQGEIAVDLIDVAPYPCSEGYYVLENASGMWAYFDASGNQVTEFIFEGATPVSHGTAWVKWQGYWGVIRLLQ